MKCKLYTIFSRFFGKRDKACVSDEKDTASVNNTHNTEEFERCVICGQLTGVPISMPIDWRDDYEVGCGQVCDECVKQKRGSTGSGKS